MPITVFVLALPCVLMAGQWSDESNLGGANANTGVSSLSGTTPVSKRYNLTVIGRLVAFLLLGIASIGIAVPAFAQVTQPVWWPPLGLYGKPLPQPYFDFPNWARYSNCRPAPLAWGFDPYVNYGPCDCPDGPESINCPGDFVAHRPNAWYFSADFAPTTVDFQNTRAIAAVGANGPTVLSTSDLEPEFDAGTRITIGRRIFGCYRLEGTYWGSYQWGDSAAVRENPAGAANLSTLLSGGFGNAAVAGLDSNSFVSIESNTKMNNAEINLLYWIDMPPGPFDVSLLCGGRYLDVRDQFNLNAINAIQENAVQVNTENRIGFLQIGLAGDWLITPRMWTNFTMKGGIGNNDAALTSQYAVTTGGTTAINTFTADQNRTAWLGDLSLVANLQMTPWLVARIGYQALFLSGLAVASDNIETNNAILANGPIQLNDGSNGVFHGPVIGLMGNW